MERDVLLQILDGFADDREDGRDAGPRLVDACVDVLQVSGAGVMVMVDEEHRGMLGGSNTTIRATEALQFSLGEGPCVDTYRMGRPVLEPNLPDPVLARWPAFSAPAVLAGVGAIFAFPLQIGAIRIGALDLYTTEPGDLSDAQFRDALIMAEVVTHAVLELQAGAEPGAFASELDVRPNRTIVHQASGMLSVQLDLPISEAMGRLRGYAHQHGIPINDVAQDVVERRLLI